MRIITASLLFFFGAAMVLGQQNKINPANQVNWPACSGGQSYAPNGNTCVASGSSGVQYDTINRHATFGDSLWVVATHDSNQDAAVNALTCNGTICTGTYTSTAPAWNVNGNQIQFTGGVTGYTAWSPSCINFSQVAIVSHTSTTFTINEADTIVPGHTGCTGSQTGTGGVLYNAENLAPSQLMRLNYFNDGGSITPRLYNRAWPGQALADLATNIATYAGDLNPDSTGIPTQAWVMSDDVCGTATLGGWQSQLGTIMTYLHAHGWYVNLMTIPNAHGAIPCGLGPNSVDSFSVNQWINAQQCTPTSSASPSPCADRVIDTWSGGLNDWTDSYVAQQSGNFSGHLTTEGSAYFAGILQTGAVNKNRPRGQANAGLGPNTFHDIQNIPTANIGSSFDLWSPAGDSTVLGQTSNSSGNGNIAQINNTSGTWRWIWRSPVCWSHYDAIVPYNAVCSANIDYPETSNNLRLSSGNGFWYSQGIVTNLSTVPTGACSPNGKWVFALDGTVTRCISGTYSAFTGGGGTPFAGTNGFVFNTSTSASRNATATDLATLNYIVDSGTTNVYAATLTFPVTSYTAGLRISIKPLNTNTTTTPTLNVNTVGANTIKKFGTVALAVGDIVVGAIADFEYDGSNFQLLNPQTGTSSVTLQGTTPITVNGDNASHTGSSFTIACSTCSVGTGTNVSVNGGAGLGTLNLTASGGTPDSGYTLLPIKLTSGTATAEIGSQYLLWACEPGLGDGLNAIPAGTYLQTGCYNLSGVTWTITNIKCYTDNNGTSTMNVTNGSGTGLLTGAVTCSNSFAAGSQSGTTTIASGDFVKFTFVADGTSKQTTFVIGGTY